MRLLLASLLLLAPSAATAQGRVTITAPTTVNADGQPVQVPNVFVRNADGSIASLVANANAATEATQLANRQALADLLTAQQATTTAQGGSNTRLDTLNTALAGGLLSREDAKTLSGQGYTVSTAIVAVSAGNSLSVELANPAGSGVNYVITARVFSNNVVGGNAPLEYTRYAATATFPTGTPTSVTVNNRLTGGPASTATFRWMMGSTVPSGAISSSGFIPTNGEEKRIKDIVIIAPGSKLIYSVGGAGGGLAATARIAVTFLFYTNPI